MAAGIYQPRTRDFSFSNMAATYWEVRRPWGRGEALLLISFFSGTLKNDQAESFDADRVTSSHNTVQLAAEVLRMISIKIQFTNIHGEFIKFIF